MIDHLGFEVADIERSARFYDAIFFPLGVRRMFEAERAIAWGVNDARFWITERGRAPERGFGHVAFEASGKAAVDAAYEAGLKAGGRHRSVAIAEELPRRYQERTDVFVEAVHRDIDKQAPGA